jgi:hypothetical protein
MRLFYSGGVTCAFIQVAPYGADFMIVIFFYQQLAPTELLKKFYYLLLNIIHTALLFLFASFNNILTAQECPDSNTS